MVNRNHNEITFVNPPFCSPGYNAAGIAYLRGFLKDKNINTSVINFNDIFHYNDRYKFIIKKFEAFLLNESKNIINEYSDKKLSPGLFLLSFNMLAYCLIHEKFDSIIRSIEKCKIFDEIFLKFFPKKSTPKIIGVSITYYSQLYFSLLLAFYFYKKHNQKIKLIAGGPLITHNIEGLKLLLKKYPLFDYMVIGEGQTALYNIFLSTKKLNDIPNLIYYNKSLKKYKSSNNLNYCENLETLPAPLYEPNDLPCIQVTRKCYWNKCSFCSNYDSTFQVGSTNKNQVKKIIYELKIIKNRIKRDDPVYNFLDSAISPAFLRLFSDKIIKDKFLPRNYRAFMRLESGLDLPTLKLAKMAGFGNKNGGKIVFGLETSSPRLQKLINKGITITCAKKIIKTCSDLKMNIQINFIYSLPTQTEKDLLADLSSALKIINGYSDKKLIIIKFSPFVLNRNSEFFNNYKKYNIKIINEKRDSMYHRIQFKYTDNTVPKNEANIIIYNFIKQHKIKPHNLKHFAPNYW